jgi:Cellulase (glycosyl hydrolase family 5)
MAARRPFFPGWFHAAVVRSLRVWTLSVSLALAVGLFVPQTLAAESPYGILIINIDSTTPRSQIARYMDAAKEAGATWVRVAFLWYSVEWSRGQWDWHYFDYVTEEATARGLKIVATLMGTPQWAATDGIFAFGVPEMAAWETFVTNTVTRYPGVTHWEILNEPNYSQYWRGTPAQYAELLVRASQRIKSVNPSAMVLLGGLADDDSLPQDFLDRILSDSTYPVGLHFDVHNIHSAFRTMQGHIDRIAATRATLARYGLTKPLVITENSYTSEVAYQNVPGYQDGEAGQARYVTDSYATLLGHGVDLVVWAALLDQGGSGPYKDSGLARPDFSSKQAFTAYQVMTGTPTPPPPALTMTRPKGTATPNGTSAVIRWTTNRAADTTVEYGRFGTSGQVTTNGSLVTSHSITLKGLTRRTTYYYRATSRTGAETVSSAILTFRTR